MNQTETSNSEAVTRKQLLALHWSYLLKSQKYKDFCERQRALTKDSEYHFHPEREIERGLYLNWLKFGDIFAKGNSFQSWWRQQRRGNKTQNVIDLREVNLLEGLQSDTDHDKGKNKKEESFKVSEFLKSLQADKNILLVAIPMELNAKAMSSEISLIKKKWVKKWTNTTSPTKPSRIRYNKWCFYLRVYSKRIEYQDDRINWAIIIEALREETDPDFWDSEATKRRYRRAFVKAKKIIRSVELFYFPVYIPE